MAGKLIHKSTFLKALTRLDEKLGKADLSITFLCVGGGTMMLALGARDQTEDIDGILRPSDPTTTRIFHRLVLEVATEFGIDPLWINTQVKDIMSGQGYQLSYFEELPQFQYGHIRLLFAKPTYVLAMKCQALRPGKRDFGDVVRLLRHLNIRTLEGLRDAIEPYGTAWEFIGNDEYELLELCIAWAFPRQTPYDHVRLEYLARVK